MQLIGQQRQWCAEQRVAYECMVGSILQELRRAEHQVEACNFESFDRMEGSLRQLENSISKSE